MKERTLRRGFRQGGRGIERWGAAAVGFAIAFPAWAQAPIQPVQTFAVAVASDPAGEAVAATLQQVGLGVLASTPPFMVDQASSIAFGADPVLQAEARNVRALIAAGLNAVNELDLDMAYLQFNEVIALFEGNPGLATMAGAEPYATALVNLGVLAYLNGDELATEDNFRAAHLVTPTVMPDVSLFPDVLDIFNRVVEEIGSAPTGTLSVSTVPAGAEIWIDGIARGVAPVDVDLPPGRHMIAARMFGYSPGGAFAEVRPRRTERASVTLNPVSGAGAAAVSMSDLAAALLEGSGREMSIFRLICDNLGIRSLLLLWVMPSDGRAAMVSIQYYDRIRDGIVASTLSPEAALDPATIGNTVAPAVAQCIQAPARELMGIAVGPPPTPPSPPWGTPDGGAVPEEEAGVDEEGSILGEWWFWTILGVVVAGGTGTGLYFGLRSEPPSGSEHPEIIIEF